MPVVLLLLGSTSILLLRNPCVLYQKHGGACMMYSGLHPKQGYRSPGTKKMYVECTKYVRRHTPTKASYRQPQTTNKRTMAEASKFCYHDISFISWPNHMFEMQKSIRSICSGHPLNLSCIGSRRLQFYVETCLLLAQS